MWTHFSSIEGCVRIGIFKEINFDDELLEKKRLLLWEHMCQIYLLALALGILIILLVVEEIDFVIYVFVYITWQKYSGWVLNFY